MTATSHPPAEQVADLLEGTLPASEAMVVNAHLAQCQDCSDLREALASVTAVLAADGAAAEPMPPDVAASVRTALSTAADPAGALEASRLNRARRRAPQVPLTWLGGAAAAVILVAAVVAGWQGVLHGGGSSDASKGYAQSGLQRRDGAHPPEDLPTGGSAGAGSDRASSPATTPIAPGSVAGPDLTPAELAAQARRLAATQAPVASAHGSRCALPAGRGPSAVIRWEGSLAVLRVLPDTRTATVLDCRTARRVLFTTGY